MFLSLFSLKANAQAPDWLWAKGIGGINNDDGISIAVDGSGNVFTTGQFEGVGDFDPGLGVFQLTSTVETDIFISKIDSFGNFMWAKAIGGNSFDIGNSIILDASGNVYITGSFNGIVDFDPDSLENFNLTSSGLKDIFVCKLDGNGNFMWAKAMGGTSDDYGRSVAVDAFSNVYTTGSFKEIADFDPDSSTNFNLTSAGSGDIFISKLDWMGNFIWAKSMGGTEYEEGHSIAIDDFGYVCIAGYFSGTVDFDPDSLGIFNLNSEGLTDIFISKLNNSGSFSWAKSIGGITNDKCYSIALDAFSNVYATGYFTGIVDFNPNAGTFNLTSAGDDIFISKLDSSGNFIWGKAIGGTSGDRGLSIALDAFGNVYTTGSFEGTTDFDPDSSGTFNLSSAGSGDMFISKLDSAGNFSWARTSEGISLEEGLSIAIDRFGYTHVTGFLYSPTVLFDNTIISNIDSTSGYNGEFTSDVFIAKLSNTITGIENAQNTNDMSVYPNPATNHLTIALADNHKKVAITITDLTGKMIYSTTATQKTEVNTTDFAQGVYLVQVQAADFTETKKLIVVK